MILILAALAAVTSPLAVFDRQQRSCEQRFADSDFVEYAGCVVHAGKREQIEFKRLISAAIHERRISSAKFRTWAAARDRQCKKVWQSGLNVNLYPVMEAVCIARADDKLLKSLQMKHR